MNGWFGRILRIDLTTGEHCFEAVDTEDCLKWIGGKGLAGKFLYPEITRACEDPQLPLIIMTGPLTGTLAPTSGRTTVMSKSPLTGAVGDCSVGGSLGWQIKKAGIDGIIITGIAKKLCGIEISDSTVCITDASGLSGRNTSELTGILKERGAVAAIGPAGENGVLFSSLMVDGSFAAGRCGIGHISGLKNLKYITVRGTGRIPVYDSSALKKAREDIDRLVGATPALSGEHSLMNCGTAACYDLMSSKRMMPTSNFRETYFSPAAGMNSHAFAERYGLQRHGCKGCAIRCKRMGKDGSHLPEFETMSHFSALIDNTDLDTVMQANRICNEAGMDTITAGATLSCHAEITGDKLTPTRIIELLNGIANGSEAELAQGSKRYADSCGMPELSMSVKGLELPGYDPRGAYGMALAYATSTRGGCHLRAYPISHEILRKPVATDRFSFEGKARMIKIAEDMNAVIDSLIACKFIFFGASLEEYADVFTAVTGLRSSAQELLKAGERIYFRERVMNYLCGFTAVDDDLPRRFFEEGGTSGNGIDVPPLDREEFLNARSRYYRIRGYSDDGIPLPTKAEELGVSL